MTDQARRVQVGRVPVVRTEFTSHDAEETEEYLRSIYADNTTRFRSVDDGTTFVGRTYGVDHVRADRLTTRSVTMDVVAEPLVTLVCGQMLGGRSRVKVGGEEVVIHPGDVFVFPVGEPLSASSRDQDTARLSLSWDRATELAAERIGTSAADLRFTSMRPVSPVLGSFFAQVQRTVHRALADGGAMTYPLIAAELVDALLAAVLTAFPNTAMATHYQPGPGHVGPPSVRRAVAFIDAHAHEAITLTDIAAAAGVTPRALQYGFARHRDHTPMAYLREARLVHAHHELQAADTAARVTVSQVATRWGFSSTTHFRRLYRDRYGVSPTHTLSN